MKSPLQKVLDSLDAIRWVQCQPYYKDFDKATLKAEQDAIQRLEAETQELSKQWTTEN